eukprot:COSAG02_NODE_40359_length_406_cov_1.156352_1_plen_27_part_01
MLCESDSMLVACVHSKVRLETARQPRH